MATLKQQKLAKGIAEALGAKEIPTAKDLLVSVGYEESTAKADPGKIIEQKGVQEELAKLGFSDEGAKKVVQEIMYDRRVKPSARLQATRQVFEVTGGFAPEKSIVAHVPLVVKILDGKDNGNCVRVSPPT